MNNLHALLDYLASKQDGTFVSLTYQKPLKAKKGIEADAVCITKVLVRKGIQYSHIAGVCPITHELPWGTWDETYRKLVINHKGQRYVRLYDCQSPKRTYLLDGQEVMEEDLIAMGIFLKSNFTHHDDNPGGVFTVLLDNLVSVR